MRRPRFVTPAAPQRLAAFLLTAGLMLSCACKPLVAQSPASGEMVKVDPVTEAVISGALKYLAAQQMPDGSWSGGKENPKNQWPVAMTSYVMMAFMANGNLPNAGPYAKQVKNGMQFLLDSAQADGTFREVDRSHYMYSHGLATMVLAELYGETQDPAIRTKLDHVVLLIVHGQNAEGGWRYQPGSKEADISVTVPQTVALCAAKRAGIAVPQATIDKAIAFIKSCQVKDEGFAYEPGKGGPNFARTAAAIYGLQLTGLYDDPVIAQGSRYIAPIIQKCNQPGWQTEWLTYGSYYAGVANYLIGGETWKAYYETFGRQYLVKHAITAGDQSHWDISLDNNAKDVGSNWCTAVFTTILSLPYGYLPLYQR